MDAEMKKPNVVSARIPADLETAARAVASAKDISLSELITILLSDCVEKEKAYAMKISAVIDVNQCLHGKQG